MKQTTKRFVSMVGSLVMVVIALMLYFSFIQPSYDDAQKVKGTQLGEEQFLRSEQNAVKQVQDLISTYQGQGEVQHAVSLALPLSEDQAGGVAQLYGLIQASNLQFKQMQISNSPPQPKNQAQGAGQNQNPSFSSLLKPIGTDTYQIKAVGTYEDFKTFMDRLVTNIRVFDVRNLKVGTNLTTGSSSRPIADLYDFEMSIDTYYQVQ